MLRQHLLAACIVLGSEIYFFYESQMCVVEAQVYGVTDFSIERSRATLEIDHQQGGRRPSSTPAVRVYSQDLDLVLDQPSTQRRQAHTFLTCGSLFRQAFDSISPRHSWIEISTLECIYSIDLLAPRQGEKRGRVLVRKKDEHDDNQRPGQIEHVVRNLEGDNMQRLAAEILKKANYFDRHPELIPEYDEMGPNSNGFVMFLVVGSGGAVDLPWNAYYSKVVRPYFDNLVDDSDDHLLLTSNCPQP